MFVSIEIGQPEGAETHEVSMRDVTERPCAKKKKKKIVIWRSFGIQLQSYQQWLLIWWVAQQLLFWITILSELINHFPSKPLEVNPIIAQGSFSPWCILTKDIFWSRIHLEALLYPHRKWLWPFQSKRLCILTGGTEPIPPTARHRPPRTVLPRHAVTHVV